jgi:hypothetical protein
MAPFQHLPTYRAIVEIMRGKRPVRPQATWSGASIEPSDAIWDLTERCWHAEPEMRLDISDVYSSLCLMNANDVSRHLHGEKPLPRKSEEDSLPTSHPIRSSSPMAQSPVKTPHFSGMSVLPRATGDAGDSGFESGDAGSSSSPRTTRQEYSACGACRMRRYTRLTVRTAWYDAYAETAASSVISRTWLSTGHRASALHALTARNEASIACEYIACALLFRELIVMGQR